MISNVNKRTKAVLDISEARVSNAIKSERKILGIFSFTLSSCVISYFAQIKKKSAVIN